MLVLRREVGQTLVIHGPGIDPIYISVNEVQGIRVRLGINADRELQVDRLEVFRAKQDEAINVHGDSV
jgi:carbon storage regulator CsrA